MLLSLFCQSLLTLSCIKKANLILKHDKIFRGNFSTVCMKRLMKYLTLITKDTVTFSESKKQCWLTNPSWRLKKKKLRNNGEDVKMQTKSSLEECFPWASDATVSEKSFFI